MFIIRVYFRLQGRILSSLHSGTYFTCVPHRYIFSIYAIFVASALLVSCSGFGGGSSGSSGNSGNSGNSGSYSPTSTTQGNTPTPTPAPLATLHWCKQPLLVFRDGGAKATGTGTPSTTGTTLLTKWEQVEPNLGFTAYLPATLPGGTCLVSASAIIHDPILGGVFTIGYLLPNHSSFSLSEAPLLSQNNTFQCSPSSTTSTGTSGTPSAATGTPTNPVASATPSLPTQLCTGTKDKTSIVLSAQGTTEALHQSFNALQSHVTWVPAS